MFLPNLPRIVPVIVACAVLWTCQVLADTKTEIELRAKLAAAEAAHAVAIRDKEAMALQLSRRGVADTAAAVGRGAAAVGRQDAAEAVVSSKISADVNATIAQQAVTVATQTALEAAKAAGEVRGQIAMLLITTIGGFLGAVAVMVHKSYSDERTRRWQLEDESRHRQELSVKLDKVAEKAEAAYKEANSVNLKIEKIGLEVKDGTELNPAEPSAVAELQKEHP